jgi:F-type H+-transporting ATPase subunit b
MLGPVSLSIPTLLIEVVIFLGTVYLMESLVFSPIRARWAERNRLIQEGLAASSEGREDVEQARAEVMRILQEARHEAQRQIDEVTASGNRLRDELVEQATAEFRRQVEAAQQQIRAERDRSASELRSRIVDIALEAARSVSGQRYEEPEVRQLAAAVVSREGLA